MMKGTSDEDSRMKMEMRAYFVHTSQCNFDLKVIFSTNMRSNYKSKIFSFLKFH